MSKVLAVAVVASLCSCTRGYIIRPGDLPPIVATVPPDQRTQIWQRAITVLLDEGYVPQVLDESAAYVSGKQRDDLTTGPLAGTMAIVTVSPEGRLRVQVSGAGVYHDLSELERDIAQIQQRLTQEILAAPGAPPH